MKKFLLAVAAIAAGVTMADPITSANVVGYAQNALQNGATIVASQFVGIGTEGGAIDLQTIKAIGDGCSDNVFISKLNSDGVIVEQYVWVNWGGDEGTKECWVDGGFNEVTDITFLPGEGLWVQAASDALGIQTSGQVSTEDITIQLQDGATPIGNGTPVTIDLQDIACSGEGCSDNVFVSKLNSDGVIVEQYMWVNWGGDEGTKECWVDGGLTEATGIDVLAGEGLWARGSSDAQFVTIPGVEL